MVMVENVKKLVFCENIGRGRTACTKDSHTYEFKDKKGEVFGSSHYEKTPDRATLIEDSGKIYRSFNQTARLFLKKQAKSRPPSTVNLEDIKEGKIRKGWYKIIGIPNGRVRVFADGTYHVAIKNAAINNKQWIDDLAEEIRSTTCLKILEGLVEKESANEMAIRFLDEKKIYGNIRELLKGSDQWEKVNFISESDRISTVRLTS